MARVYATPDQLAAYTGQPAPADAERLLLRASQDIEAVTVTAVYDTDAVGLPTDPDIAEAMSTAVCAQVEWRAATSDDGTGAVGQWDSVSIGPVSMSGRRSGGASDGVGLAPRAEQALRTAGLMPGVVW
ncbi:hypothetical protein [Streptomyces sp. NPDC002644]